MSTNASHGTFVDSIERHRTILFKIASAYCRDAADREDLVQETIVQLWRAHSRFDGRSSFSTWMYRIAMNVAISFVRSETRKRGNLVPASDSIFDEIPAPQTECDDRLSLVRDLIERLDPLNRALMLLYLDDYPYAEIATILGISETNVATKLGRIKEQLKRDVAGDDRH